LKKQEVIREIVSLQHQFSRIGLCYAFESWKKLDVPIAQLKSLFIIANREDINFKILAQDLRVTPGNVTGIIDRLVEQGLVSRQPNPEDRRKVRLQATKRGHELLATLTEAHTGDMLQIMDLMSTEELLALSRGLSGLINALNEYREEFSKKQNGEYPKY